MHLLSAKFRRLEQTLPLVLVSMAAATVMTLHYPLMVVYRKAFPIRYPHIAQAWTSDGSFAAVGTTYPYVIEEACYATRAQTAATHGLPYDGFRKKNRNLQMLSVDFLAYALLGAIQRVTGNIHWTWSIARWFSGVCWFFFLFRIAFHFTRFQEFSFFFAAFITFFSYILTFMFVYVLRWGDLMSLRGILKIGWTLACYGRTESLLRLPRPGMSYAALFCAGWLTLRALERTDNKSAAVAGVMGGLLAYFHLDVWSTHVGSCCLLALWQIYRTKKLVHPTVTMAACALAVSLPWLALNFPPNPELIARGAQFTRSPKLYSLLYLFLAAAGLRHSLEQKSLSIAWLSCFIASLFLLLNVNVLTGYDVQSRQWTWFGNLYAALLLLLLFKKRWRKWKRGWLVASAALFLATAAQNVFYAAIHYPAYSRPKQVEEALDWLKRNADVDSIVAVLDPKMIPLIASESPAGVLITYGSPIMTDISVSENVDRIVYALRLYGIPLQHYLESTHFFRTFVNHFFGHFVPPEKRIRDLLRRSSPPEQAFAVDYIWVGPLERSLLNARRPARAQNRPVFKNSRISLYKISRQEARRIPPSHGRRPGPERLKVLPSPTREITH